MSSVSAVTTKAHATGSVDWEVKDVCLQIDFCKNCSQDFHHVCQWLVKSPILKIEMSDGKFVKWQLQFGRESNYSVDLTLFILFLGVFDENEVQVSDQLQCYYEVAVLGGPSHDMTELVSKSNKGIFASRGARMLETLCHLSEFFDSEYGRCQIWPHGNLKVSVKFYQLLDTSHEVSVGNPRDEEEQVAQNSLANSFGQLLSNPLLSDVKILCGESTFHAHKLILSVRSRVFKAMLEAEMLEAKNKEIKITDLKLQTVETMLKYIYTGEIIIPADYKDLLELLDCAEKYELEDLKSVCLKKMTSTLGDHNVGEYAIAAEMYNARPVALAIIKDYCMKNHVRLMKNAVYKKNFLANPELFIC